MCLDLDLIMFDASISLVCGILSILFKLNDKYIALLMVYGGTYLPFMPSVYNIPTPRDYNHLYTY